MLPLFLNGLPVGLQNVLIQLSLIDNFLTFTLVFRRTPTFLSGISPLGCPSCRAFHSAPVHLGACDLIFYIVGAFGPMLYHRLNACRVVLCGTGGGRWRACIRGRNCRCLVWRRVLKGSGENGALRQERVVPCGRG
ncbi:hypothetical protein KC19_11G100800 [Ceratodon purpureus]|uniref:Uncharacterized protein n=1 Tax=Ceratodon purpureus TaxID=3225 RepID=A0A8T0GIX2_CERPU|nr:hypothetical protein KC19_11G100800 [Ceratodon purpureus]